VAAAGGMKGKHDAHAGRFEADDNAIVIQDDKTATPAEADVSIMFAAASSLGDSSTRTTARSRGCLSLIADSTPNERFPTVHHHLKRIVCLDTCASSFTHLKTLLS
jgi:hypothetical protein